MTADPVPAMTTTLGISWVAAKTMLRSVLRLTRAFGNLRVSFRVKSGCALAAPIPAIPPLIDKTSPAEHSGSGKRLLCCLEQSGNRPL